MICDPSQNSLNISPGPGISLPGLGLPFSVPKIPYPDVNLPYGPEDLLDLLDKIFAYLPQGIKLVPNADSLMKDVWDAIASLLNQLAPFLAIYKFFQALMNMLLCVIDVLCALSNPWATVKAMRRLFKRCIPDFLSLFPWLALLLMILALILLLIALIEYIINTIADYIEQLIANLKILARALTLDDEDSILAATNKIAYLLCLFEQLFSILLALSALFAIIRPLMNIGGSGVCSRGSGSSCCSEDFCPDFIADYSPDGAVSKTGFLIHFSEIGVDYPDDDTFSFLRNINLSPQRDELIQLVDNSEDFEDKFKFTDIITPSPEYGFTYWPEGESYDSDANIVRVPYLVDLNVSLDPRNYGNSSDLGGYRKFNIRDVVVKYKPTTKYKKWNNTYQTIESGCIVLGGGTVWEYNEAEDGYTSQYYIDEEAATIDSLLTKSSSLSSIPSASDADGFAVDYNFRFNYEVLIDKKLISNMCQPDLATESAVVNAEFNDLRSILDKVGDLPDIGTLSLDRASGTGTLGCLVSSLGKFRANITEETANTFQEEVTECLNDLKDECVDFYCRGAIAAADRFSSDLEIDPDLQFVDQTIEVTVTLKDKTGGFVANGITDDIASCIAKSLKGEITLGEITDFEYDGYGNFIATISNEKQTTGEGELTVYIDGETFAKIENRDNDDEATSIETRITTYEFVGAPSLTYRRDQGDLRVNDFNESDIT